MIDDKQLIKNEQLIKEYTELSTKVSIALIGLQDAMKDINDTNILHTRTLEKFGTKVDSNTQAINEILKFWSTMFKWIILALIALAGVNQVGKLLNVG